MSCLWGARAESATYVSVDCTRPPQDKQLPAEVLERETGFEPATLSLGKAKKVNKRREDASNSFRGRAKGGKERQ